MRLAIIILLANFSMGCTVLLYSPQDLMSNNRARLPSLNRGMTKDEVMKHMGTEGKRFCNFTGPLFTCVSSEMINNPYRTAGFQLEGKEYEVLYYWTDAKHRDMAITDDELTPLIFENGKLVGWGRELLDAKIAKYELRVR